MKPIIILPPDTVSEPDIKELRSNGLCVVVSKDPSKVKFIDPIPAQSSRTQIEDAAIKLSRKLLAGELVGQEYKKNIAGLFVELLTSGTPLDARGSIEEQEAAIISNARRDELGRIGREESRAARAAQKAK